MMKFVADNNKAFLCHIEQALFLRRDAHLL